MDFKIKNGEQYRLVSCVIDSSTVIEPGDLVTLSSGLIVKATAGSTAVAYAPKGSLDGDTTCEVTIGNDFTLVGTADANFAVTDKGITCDVVVSTGAQLIDLGETATDVLKVDISADAGVAGSADNVTVQINAPLF